MAACAPSDKFLNMGGPLAIGLGAVFAASLGSMYLVYLNFSGSSIKRFAILGMFLPPTTALGAGLYSISLYGGLVCLELGGLKVGTILCK